MHAGHAFKCLASTARTSIHLGTLTWLSTGAAGGGVAWGPNVAAGEPAQAETRREVLFDHYHQHTGVVGGRGCHHQLGL